MLSADVDLTVRTNPLEVLDPMEVATMRSLYRPGRQCTATSKQSQQRCRRCAIPGGHVCASHGGNAPAVRAKAQQRMAALVDPALRACSYVLEPRQRRANPALACKVAFNVLDRNGIGVQNNRPSSFKHPEAAISSVSMPTYDVQRLTDGELHELARLMRKIGWAPAGALPPAPEPIDV